MHVILTIFGLNLFDFKIQKLDPQSIFMMVEQGKFAMLDQSRHMKLFTNQFVNLLWL